ncbi:MAG: tripartite tricarboxylate transporter permease [Halobacteria archaeon]
MFPVEIALFSLAGFLLGVVSGLTPGLHVNTFALLLAGAASSFPGVEYLGVTMVAAAISHSFLDIVPSVAVGVPDDSMALAALPGHEMVLEGRGNEAVRLSAAGSMLSVAAAFALVLPLTVVATSVYGVVENYFGYLLAGIAGYLLWTESGGFRRKIAAFWTFFSSGVLGYYVFEGVSETGELLMPLFTGLFGVPLLISSYSSDAEIPEQREMEGSLLGKKRVLVDSLGGGFAGAVVGWIPGASPAVATTLIQSVLPDTDTESEGRRSFVTAVSGVNTSNSIYALVALYFLGRERSGVAVAVSRLGKLTEKELVLYLTILAAVSFLAFHATILAGRLAFGFVRAVNYRALSLGILGLLVALTSVLSGLRGLPVLAAATVIGAVPNLRRVRRVHCMGSLLVPLILFYAGH